MTCAPMIGHLGREEKLAYFMLKPTAWQHSWLVDSHEGLCSNPPQRNSHRLAQARGPRSYSAKGRQWRIKNNDCGAIERRRAEMEDKEM